MGEQEREGTAVAQGAGQGASAVAGAVRSQHIVLQGSADARMIAAALRPGVERSREMGENGAPACLVITPTIEQAFQAARQARAILDDNALRVVPVSSVTRARRIVSGAPVAVVAGTANDLLALRRDAALSLEAVRAIVIVALDDVLAAGGVDTLQALFADAPDDTMRVATVEADSADVDAFVEAHLRKARRISPVPTPERPLEVVPHYAITTAAGRADTLRAVLDEVDPPSLVVIAYSDDALADAQEALAEIGMIVDDEQVRVTRDAPASHVALVVFWEAPHSLESLEQALSARPVDSVALLLPDEVPAFRRLSGHVAEAWNPPARKEGAAQRVNQLRTALRSTLANSAGASASELALLAPLLDSFDALEVAAAALRLYEGARRDVVSLKTRLALTPSATASGSDTGARAPRAAAAGSTSDRGAPERGAARSSGRQRVFLAVGKRDNVRPGDIVGAIANEVGIPGERIGTIDLFESHSIVELGDEDAARALEALGDVAIRGRKLNARLDERGGSGGARPRGGDRPAFRGDRDRPRSFDRGDRGDRGDRAGRGERSDRGERGPRLHRGDRDDARGDRGGRPPRGEGRGDSRGDSRGPARGGFRGGRNDAAGARREFGDRPPRERTEPRREWSERGERMQHARRPARPSRPDTDAAE